MKRKQPRAALRLAGILCLGCLLVGCERSDEATGEPDSGEGAGAAVVKPNVAREPVPASPPIVAAA